jgi:DAK2 domain fusion protein YloV
MKTIDGQILKKSFDSAINAMLNNQNRIDALNVFPVPDGDTGSNMSSTIKYAGETIESMKTNHIGEIATKFARGMLLGARGNSGVILSQIFKGFSIPLKNIKVASVFEITKSFEMAKELAYKSVIKPVEGTILTVISDVSDYLNKSVTPSDSIEKVFEKATKAARKSVNNTPNLLPVLKEVGVVDSGGEGLFQIINAIHKSLLGEDVKLVAQSKKLSFLSNEIYKGKFGYCTEFISELKSPKSFSKDKFTGAIQKMGSSLVIVQDKDILKVHIHTLKPGYVLIFSQKFGEFLKIKIDNMTEQASSNKKSQSKSKDSEVNVNNPNEKKSNIGIISCNNGQGIINDMKELGANFIIEGGQTLNPSARDIIEAIKEVNSDNIIILPNNSNIILAAQQAAQTIRNKSVHVLNTKTQMEGIVAMMNFNKDGKIKEVSEEMEDSIEEVKTGQVTLTSRDTKIEGIKVYKDQFLAIANKTILGSYSKMIDAGIHALKKLIDEDSEVVTIYFGDSASDVDANEIASFVENNYDVEVEVKSGDQLVYHFIFGVE